VAQDVKNESAGGYIASLAGKVKEKIDEKLGVESFDTLDESVADWRKKGYEVLERTDTRALLVSEWSTRKSGGGWYILAVASLVLTMGLALPLVIAVWVMLRVTGRAKKKRFYVTLEVGEDGRVHSSAVLR
jgi:hypothetical protein